jgi:hypothetical protein
MADGGKGMGKGKDGGRYYRPHQLQGSSAFDRFAVAARLPDMELHDWEHDMRQQLLDILDYVGPLPLIEWIDNRIGGEIESYVDETGGQFIRRRRLNQANSAPPGKGKGKDRAVTKAMKKDAKGGERRIAFFESLPNDSFSPPEIKLRTAVFEFLARWQLKKKATLADLCNDRAVQTFCGHFIPKVVPLKEWIERRMGAEILFHSDQRGIDIVEVSPEGQEQVREVYAVLQPAGPLPTPQQGEKRPHNSNPPQEKQQQCARTRLSAMVARLHQPMTKDSITWDIEEVDGQHRATCILSCLGGEEYVGEFCSDAKEAKESAAEVAIAAKLPDMPPSKKPRQQGAPSDGF